MSRPKHGPGCRCPRPTRLTYCQDCGELLPDHSDVQKLLVALDKVMKRIEGKIEERPAQPSPDVPRPDGDALLIDAGEAGRIVGRSADWCRENVGKLGGRRDGEGERPRVVFPRAAVIGYVEGGKPHAAALMEKPRSNGRLPSTALIPIKGGDPLK
jgi:hypothetical protein